MNYEQMSNNKVQIQGEVVSQPEFSHEIYGEGFYDFNIKVNRLSESSDIIPATISDRLLSANKIKLGSIVCGVGQFRSYNKLVNGKSKLMLTVFIRELVDEKQLESPNSIDITGFICKEPIYRTTPFNREICDVLLAVNRTYNKSDYLPCIAWGRNARFIKDFKIGDKVAIKGRIQSRNYQKKTETGVENRVAYEVSINRVTTDTADDYKYDVRVVNSNIQFA